MFDFHGNRFDRFHKLSVVSERVFRFSIDHILYIRTRSDVLVEVNACIGIQQTYAITAGRDIITRSGIYTVENKLFKKKKNTRPRKSRRWK